MKQITIVEDEIIVAKGMADILSYHGYKIIDIATNYAQAKQKLLSNKPDLLLCDINLGGEKTGIDLLNELNQQLAIPFIFVSSYSDLETVKNANKLMPQNYITKPFTDKQLVTSVQRVLLENNPSMEYEPTERELEILRLISHGQSSKEVAQSLNITFNTVETHRKNLMRKFGMTSMTELVCMATSKGWIEYRKKQ